MSLRPPLGLLDLSTPDLPAPAPATTPSSAPPPTRSWLEHDLACAREVQRAFMPAVDRRWGEVQVLAESLPAHSVGGDFFEVCAGPGGRLTAVVGDVAGKGVSAALIMARVSQELRRHLGLAATPAGLLGKLNRWLDEQGLYDRFVTAVCVQLDVVRRRWVAGGAGHPPGLLYRADGSVERLAEGSGPAMGLGGLAPWQCEERELEARPGDTLLLLTDGFTDVVDAAGLAALLCGRPPPALAEVRDRLHAQLRPLVVGRDDATLVALRLDPPPATPAC